MLEIDQRKSLMELDPETWDPEALDEDGVTLARRVAGKPLRRLGAAELEACLSRNLSLPFAAPRVIEILDGDPFLQAGPFPGDLLTALIESDSRFWDENIDLWRQVIGILESALSTVQRRMEEEERENYLPWHLGDAFMAALLHFREIHREG